MILSASTLEKAENAKAQSQYAQNIFPLKLDISVEADFHAAVQWIEEKFSKLDVLINNATVTKATPVLEITAADFDWVTQVNQRGTFQACQIIGQYILKGYGRIINMASLAGQNGGTATGAHYAATKGTIVTLTKILPKSLRQKVLRSMRLHRDQWSHQSFIVWYQTKKWNSSSRIFRLKP